MSLDQVEFGNRYDTDGRRLATPFADLLQWPSGRILEIPSLAMAKRGGWVYKPEGVATKKDKHFGRGEEGRKRAHRFLREMIREAYELEGNQPPSIIAPEIAENDANVTSGYYSNYSSQYQWKTKYGYVGTGVKTGYEDEVRAWTTIPTALVASLYTGDSMPLQRANVKIEYVVARGKADRGKFIESWIDNPYKAMSWFPNINDNAQMPFSDRLLITNAKIARLNQYLEPTTSFKPYWQKASAEYRGMEDGNGWMHDIKTDFLLQSARYRTEILDRSTIAATEALTGVLGEVGVKMHLEVDGHRQFVSLSFEVPGDGTKHNRDGHVLTIRPTGVEVSCGFVNNEDNYVNDQSRQALSEIAKMLQEDMEG